MPASELELTGLAETIAADCAGDGAIVIFTKGSMVKLGAWGMCPEEVREALCAAIHGTFMAETFDAD